MKEKLTIKTKELLTFPETRAKTRLLWSAVVFQREAQNSVSGSDDGLGGGVMKKATQRGKVKAISVTCSIWMEIILLFGNNVGLLKV